MDFRLKWYEVLVVLVAKIKILFLHQNFITVLRIRELTVDTKKNWMWTHENSFKDYFNISPRSCRIKRSKTTFPHIIENLNEKGYKLFKKSKLDLGIESGQQGSEYIFGYHKEVDVEYVNLIELMGPNEINIDDE
jgi:hypothetical protein